MRCRACDCNLSDAESTLKSEETGEYLDMCFPCLSTTDIGFLADDSIIIREDEDYLDGDLLTP